MIYKFLTYKCWKIKFLFFLSESIPLRQNNSKQTKPSNLKNNFIYVYMCVVCTHVCSYPQKLEDSVRSPRARVPGSCEPPSMGAENLQVLCKQFLWTIEPSLQPPPTNF